MSPVHSPRGFKKFSQSHIAKGCNVTNIELRTPKAAANNSIVAGTASSITHFAIGSKIFSYIHSSADVMLSINGCNAVNHVNMEFNNGEKSRLSAHSTVASAASLKLCTIIPIMSRILHKILYPVSFSAHASLKFLARCPIIRPISPMICKISSNMVIVSGLSHTLKKSFPICFNNLDISSRAYFHESITNCPSLSHAFLKGLNRWLRISSNSLRLSFISDTADSVSSNSISGISILPAPPVSEPLPPLFWFSTFNLSNGAKALLAAFPAFSTLSFKSSAPPAAPSKSSLNFDVSAVGKDIPNNLAITLPIALAIAIT